MGAPDKQDNGSSHHSSSQSSGISQISCSESDADSINDSQTSLINNSNFSANRLKLQGPTAVKYDRNKNEIILTSFSFQKSEIDERTELRNIVIEIDSDDYEEESQDQALFM